MTHPIIMNKSHVLFRQAWLVYSTLRPAAEVWYYATYSRIALTSFADGLYLTVQHGKENARAEALVYVLY